VRVENTDLTRAIHALTREIHQHVLRSAATTTEESGAKMVNLPWER